MGHTRGHTKRGKKGIKVVPGTGLEPVLPKEADFKSAVSAIPPSGHHSYLIIYRTNQIKSIGGKEFFSLQVKIVKKAVYFRR